MTETENKYFAVNIYDENSVSFYKTEEEAKKACLNVNCRIGSLET